MNGNWVAEITKHFVNLTDPRMNRTKLHDLSNMIVMTLCATLCGANSWQDVVRFVGARLDWFSQFLDLPHGVPSHDTFSRVFRRLDTPEFEACLIRWIADWRLDLQGRGVAFDGKTLRGSLDRAVGKSAKVLVSAYVHELRICLGQVTADEDSNEITAAPQLLKLLTLKGAVVTMDAAHCQQTTVAEIREQKADYLIALKGNQPTLHAAVEDAFLKYGEDDYQSSKLQSVTTQETNRGRQELREYHVAPAPAAWRNQFGWQDLRSIGMVYRHRELANGTIQEETCYYISSLRPDAKKFAKLVRGHWSIENSLHHTLDVTFDEDQSRIRKANGPEVIAVFRRLALNILQQDTTIKDNIRGKRNRAGWSQQDFEGILCGFRGN